MWMDLFTRDINQFSHEVMKRVIILSSNQAMPLEETVHHVNINVKIIMFGKNTAT